MFLIPQNLIIITFVQAVIFGTVRLLPNTSSIFLVRWIKVAVLGIIYGMLLDILLGRAGIFAYLPAGPQSMPIQAINLPIFLLIFNAFISYGLAIATTALISDSVITNCESPKFWQFVSGITTTAGAIGIIFSEPTSLLMMISSGLVLVSAGELLLTFTQKCGPLITLLSGESFLPFVKLWAFSILIGTAYEIANFFFPFWVWLPNAEIPESLVSILIVLFGYFALFHSIAAIWYLINPESHRNQQ